MTDIYLRNTATIERLAREILEQCAHYRRNRPVSDYDETRFWFIEIRAEKLLAVSKQAARRADAAVNARLSLSSGVTAEEAL
jgi:hypothetical protein